jgi:site-specific recombinase XerC
MTDMSAAYVEAFLEMMSAERGAAANTLQSYERDLEDARSFLRSRGTGLTDASADDLRSYLSHLAGQGFKASSQARRLSAPPAILQVSLCGRAAHGRPDGASSTRRRKPAPFRRPSASKTSPG